jgi:hypothetical protein
MMTIHYLGCGQALMATRSACITSSCQSSSWTRAPLLGAKKHVLQQR